MNDEAAMLVTVIGGKCLQCGGRVKGAFGEELPVVLRADAVRASSAAGCSECGGQVQLEVRAATPAAAAREARDA